MSTSTLEQLPALAERVMQCAGSAADTLAALDHLVAWCQAARIECAQALFDDGLGHLVAPTPLRGHREVEALTRGAATASRAPSFIEAMRAGEASEGHLLELGHSLRRLTAEQQQALLASEATLRVVAKETTVNEFARFLRREERRLGRVAGQSTLEQQQRAVRLTSRTERESGMRVYTLRLDPLSAVPFEQRLDAAVEALFHDSAPPGCPTDPLERHAFLRAHALLLLSEGRGGRSGRPEMVVVIDTAVEGDGPEIDWGLPVEIPARVLEALWPTADIAPVIVRNGVVLHAPGELSLGRSTRLANRAQRRALRAMYSTCAIPGCHVRFQHCKIHHVVWWRNGGSTDLANLLPLCHKHHGNVHLDGWGLELSPRRELTVTLPDGRITSTGPPRRVAA